MPRNLYYNGPIQVKDAADRLKSDLESDFNIAYENVSRARRTTF